MSFQIKSKSVTAVVTVTNTVRDWDLYSSVPGAEEAAERLNAAATLALAAGNRADAAQIFDSMALDLRQFGAADSEPRCAFTEMLDAVYGPEEY